AGGRGSARRLFVESKRQEIPMSNKSNKISTDPSSSLGIAATSELNYRHGDYQATFSNSLLTAMLAFRDGDFEVRMPCNLIGIEGKIADAFNEIVRFSDRRARETVRISRAVGKEGKLKQRMSVPEGVGGWAHEVAAINILIDDLV